MRDHSPVGAPRGSGDSSAERAVSDLIGFVLVFSLIAAVVAVVSLAGLSSLEGARDAQQTNNAERAMEVLSDNMADVTERGAPSRATEISLADASLYMDDPTLIEVSDPDNGDPSFMTTRVFKVRPIVYRDQGAELVYANGAVFRVEDDGGVVLRSWEPVLDEDRTMIPIINTASSTSGPQSIKSSTVLVRANAYQRVVPLADDTGVYDDVWINVTSPRRDLWKRMLEADDDLECSTAGPERIECELQYTPDRIYVVDTRISVALKP
ncbi:DUF7289 family protein [Halosimplex salinum]|uniref:DUF7289 family protein n=1 Tax=Halosimplex salinum TaxID=1710538 RepID=UPI000F46A675|nr:hypothetical protein [Halosimplex salinum]